MRLSETRWSAALAEHDAAVRDFVLECDRIALTDWQRPPAPVALHLCRSHEMGSAEGIGGPGMRMKVSPSRARILRAVVLPYIIATSRFPRVRAPREVAPDERESAALARDVAMERLRRVASEAGGALRRAAEDPALRVTHAYFGPMTPYRILRPLSAHTRHHTRTLSQEMRAGTPGY